MRIKLLKDKQGYEKVFKKHSEMEVDPKTARAWIKEGTAIEMVGWDAAMDHLKTPPKKKRKAKKDLITKE